MTRSPAALALALVLSACAEARPRLAPEVTAAADGWPVTGANPRRWDAPLAFGPYRTGAVADGGTRGWSFEILGLGGLAKSTRPYALRLEGPRGGLDAECHERTHEAIAPFGVRVDASGSRGDAALACAFRSAEDAAWALAIRATGRPVPAWAGELRSAAGRVYAIESSHALAGSPVPLGTPAAWRLAADGATPAVVEVLNAGRVWVPRDARDPDALAAAAAALLLFELPAGD